MTAQPEQPVAVPAPAQVLALVDDMPLAAYLVSHGLPIVEWRLKPDRRHWWAVFARDYEYQRLRLAWPLSVEFITFRVYADLVGQVKEREQTP